MFIIFGLFLLILTGLYTAFMINHGLNISGFYRFIAPSIFVLSVIFMLFVMLKVRAANPTALTAILEPVSYIIMGCLAITVTVFVLDGIINIPNIFIKSRAFSYYSTVFSLILSAVLCLSALINFYFVLKIKEVKISVPNLPIETLKIVHLSDIHINSFTSKKNINQIFDKAASLEPDIVVITGDVIDIDINKDDKFLEYGFSKLKGKYGVFAVSGNHEYYAGIDAFYEMFRKLGVKVLNDESVLIINPNGERIENIINIAGINDKNWRNEEKIKQSLQNINPKYPVLFLSHRPETFDAASKYARIIELAGHTHAGQIPPIWIARKFFMKYNYGLYRLLYKNGQSNMYVTSGTRLWGPPMRLFSSSEIAVIILQGEKNAD